MFQVLEIFMNKLMIGQDLKVKLFAKFKIFHNVFKIFMNFRNVHEFENYSQILKTYTEFEKCS